MIIPAIPVGTPVNAHDIWFLGDTDVTTASSRRSDPCIPNTIEWDEEMATPLLRTSRKPLGRSTRIQHNGFNRLRGPVEIYHSYARWLEQSGRMLEPDGIHPHMWAAGISYPHKIIDKEIYYENSAQYYGNEQLSQSGWQQQRSQQEP